MVAAATVAAVVAMPYLKAFDEWEPIKLEDGSFWSWRRSAVTHNTLEDVQAKRNLQRTELIDSLDNLTRATFGIGMADRARFCFTQMPSSMDEANQPFVFLQKCRHRSGYSVQRSSVFCQLVSEEKFICLASVILFRIV